MVVVRLNFLLLFGLFFVVGLSGLSLLGSRCSNLFEGIQNFI
jgi:hypothetical protein